MNEHMVTMDPPDHTRERALLMRLITPKRLSENEEFMWRLADRQLDEMLAGPLRVHLRLFPAVRHAGRGRPPRRARVRAPAVPRGFRPAARPPGELGAGDEPAAAQCAGVARRVLRRLHRGPPPRAARDVLTDLALAKFPDGSTPDVLSVVRTATFLFAAGQETTARLLATALKYLAEYPELQDELRAHRERIPDFIEEALRIESPVKADFRLARRATTVGGVDIPAGNAGDAAQRCRQPRSRAGSSAPPSSGSIGRTPRSTSRSGAASTRAPAGRWRGPRAASASSASSTGCATSGSPRSTTAPPATAGSTYEPTWVLRGLHELHIEFTPGRRMRDATRLPRRPVGDRQHRHEVVAGGDRAPGSRARRALRALGRQGRARTPASCAASRPPA